MNSQKPGEAQKTGHQSEEAPERTPFWTLFSRLRTGSDAMAVTDDLPVGDGDSAFAKDGLIPLESGRPWP